MAISVIVILALIARDDDDAKEAVAAIEGWNARLAEGREAWVSPSIRAALVAEHHWLTVYCPGCRTSRAIDIRAIDRQRWPRWEAWCSG